MSFSHIEPVPSEPQKFLKDTAIVSGHSWLHCFLKSIDGKVYTFFVFDVDYSSFEAGLYRFSSKSESGGRIQADFVVNKSDVVLELGSRFYCGSWGNGVRKCSFDSVGSYNKGALGDPTPLNVNGKLFLQVSGAYGAYEPNFVGPNNPFGLSYMGDY